MKDLNCLRCGRRMEFCRREYLQLGKTGWITGDWGNLLAGAMDVVVLRCPDCGKPDVRPALEQEIAEFYRNQEAK